jgi:hypothetical protein
MEINRIGRGCTRRTLPKTTKTTKQKHLKQPKTLGNLMEIKGDGRGCVKGPYHKPPKPVSKNNQNHTNHQKQANLIDIERNGRGCHRRTLPTTTKTCNQQQPKQPKTLANLMDIKGNGRGCPRGPTTNHQNTKQKQPKPPKPPTTSKSDGNQQKW